MSKIGSFIVDAMASLSVFGIWPRFIEPRLLKKTTLDLEESTPFQKIKIIQLSDLHFHKGVSSSFLRKISKKVNSEAPDLIVYTGDFICYSRLEDKERLKNFLNTLKAPLGCFCTFGNHDYASYITRNKAGDYAPSKPIHPLKGVLRGLKTLFQKQTNEKGKVTKEAASVGMHEELVALLKETPFKLLENESVLLPFGLNIVGLGDYALGRCLPELAFRDYQNKFPGIILSHNPDTFPTLKGYPGQIILSGHSHGEQIHFPFPKKLRQVSQKLARLENEEYTRGLFIFGSKKLYVNRGLGGHKPFRFLSPPEILVINLRKKDE